MTRSAATQNLENINMVLKGTSKIIEAIDAQKSINVERSIRALCLSQRLLARVLRNVVCDATTAQTGSLGIDDLFADVFKSKQER